MNNKRMPSDGSEKSAHQDNSGLERIIFFSDAVFAIAITLLVLDLRLPAGIEITSDGQLLDQLLAMWHKYLAYIISFLVIGSFWVGHHRNFQLIRRYDSRLMMLNIFLLMVIAFIPFPSSLISEYSSKSATIAYALTIMLASLLSMSIWWYASSRNRLIDNEVDLKLRNGRFFLPLATSFVFLISIGIAYINTDAAKFSWLLILPVYIYANRKNVSNKKQT